jgi:TonB-linked SusC/RagA family outer membrane protein
MKHKRQMMNWTTVRQILFFVFVCTCTLSVYAQQNITVSGVVTDEINETMPGVTITIKGSPRGVATDVDGSFKIDVKSDDVLLVSFLGYEQQSIPVENRHVIAIQLKPKKNELDEVTIVAFGKQKKNSVIGSITTVDIKDLKVPSSNLTTAFAGNIAGIIAYQRSGEPGADNADFFVRGITTFGANIYPLILIDNIELTSTDLARLQPDDIASFTIMKDATATALYGARGANGVILVTTKQGKEGPAKISIRVESSISAPTRNVEFADPVTYMKLYNESILTRNPLGETMYTQDKINNTMRPGSNPYIYPANDWRKMMFNDYAMNQRATVNVSGGGGVARYFVSASATQDNGILKTEKRNSFDNNLDIKKYTLRSNINIDVTKTSEMILRLTGNFDESQGPLNGGADVYKQVVHANPVMFPAYYPQDEEHKYVNHIMFGNYRGAYTNPYAEMVRGYKNDQRSQMLAQLEGKQDLKFITEGLSLRAMINIARLSEFDVKRRYNPFWYELAGYNLAANTYHVRSTNADLAPAQGGGTTYLSLEEGEKNVESTLYTESTLNYARVFGKHSVGGLLVFTTREFLKANQKSLQLSLPNRNVGLSGRATYGFDNRYFVEFNFGYNGSERFAANHRFGFFPSAGAAWSIANENFWEDLRPVVNNLKLRYSYGLVGNDQIGDNSDRFFYLSEVNMNAAGASFGNFLYNNSLPGVRVTRYADDHITWEQSTKQNGALELGLWNKINLIAEYFTEYRRNILMDRANIPATMGLTAPLRANVGEASSHGFDLTADYSQSWSKDFWTSARLNFTYATSQFEVYEEPDYPEKYRQHVGYSLNQVWGYIAERLFIDDAEARNSPPQEFGSPYGGGDIKYTDVNRDGKITPADMVPIGNPTTPEIIYGFGISAGYKGFDASVFFQGAGNESFWINAAATSPFQGSTQLLKYYADSYWSETNQNVYALWPRLDNQINNNNVPGSYYDRWGNQQWGDKNTWFMRDGSFIRLKQMEIGYTIPGKWQEKLHIGNLRIYLSGTNLLTFSKFKLWDVEMAGDGLGYPVQRVFNMGINLSFN